ncbi:holo-ACP synthase [Syntrophomonas palmitatica]|uniref:holo-ACP synthase n=1 Tax=Syntrophomonas palmitatica TaxID=402877 RepID=UPI0006D1EE71|nr:holo-ACP synthase [Syntrophomonas palmitatica]
MLIGVDIIDIDRIQAAAARTPRFLYRLFTERELSYCMNKANPYPSLAARFAAKEAFRKLDSVLSRGIGFQDVEVIVNNIGKPELVLHGQALEKCRQANIRNFALSLSHSRNQAVAALIAEKG